MVIIKSFIVRPGVIITDLEETSVNPKKYFIDLDDKGELSKIADMLDPYYINGAILIQYCGEMILGFKHWDLVDQLWSYLIDMVDELLISGKSSTLFADQSLKIEIVNRSSDSMLLRCDQDQWILPKIEFLSTLLKSGRYFFETLASLFIMNGNDYCNEVKKIDKIEKHLLKITKHD